MLFAPARFDWQEQSGPTLERPGQRRYLLSLVFFTRRLIRRLRDDN